MSVRPTTVSASAIARSKGSRIQTRSFSKFDLYGSSPIPENKLKFIPNTGTYPLGFSVGSVKAGIKPERSPQPDLVLVASDRPSCGAARSKGHGIRGIIANSGCANLFTGEPGLRDTREMGDQAANHVAGEGEQPSFLVMHTGAGGQRLPMEKIVQNMPKLCQNMGSTHNHWLEAATGMLTTDTFPKMASRTFTLPSSPGVEFRLAGITKGAGMIHPNMATTLGIMCTDAPVTPSALQQLLSTAADKPYNCISIEGDTSTNDMVALLANGAAGGRLVDFNPSLPHQSRDLIALQKILIEYMAELAKLVVRDGEGATKFVTIRVRGAPSYTAGNRIASAIARSVLFKTGIYGEDPGWGCVSVALGYSLADTEFAGQASLGSSIWQWKNQLQGCKSDNHVTHGRKDGNVPSYRTRGAIVVFTGVEVDRVSVVSLRVETRAVCWIALDELRITSTTSN
ncbi:ArgJ family-domain-containing protein [Delphinella strobiligena]|nr:ArgJ family-domain-containing protein [Delphinella strobiligena]